MADQWFVHQGGTQLGPFSFAELKARAASGAVTAEDSVWSESLAEWTAAGMVPGLLPVSPFARIQDTFRQLSGLRDAGRINDEQLREAMARLRCQDEAGAWWQLRPDDRAWLRWDGAVWTPAAPPAAAVSEPAAGMAAAPGGPQTLAQLAKQIGKGLLKSVPKKIALVVGMFVGVWFLHTVVMMYLNQGWGNAQNWLYASMTVMRGGQLGGALFWMLLVMLVTLLISRRRKGGLGSDLAALPRTIGQAFESAGTWGRALALGLAAATVLIGFAIIAVWPIGGPYTPNRPVYVLAAVLLLLSLSNGDKAFVFLVSRLAWSDVQRWRHSNPARPFDRSVAVLGMVGVIGGFLLTAVLPFLPVSGVLAVVLLVVAAVVMGRAKGPAASAGVFLLLVGVAMLLRVEHALADDTSGYEYDTFGEMITAPEFVVAVAFSALAGIGAVLGALLPNVVTDAIGEGAAGVLPPAPLPPADVLQGEEAMRRLEKLGLATPDPDGGWMKVGDWTNATGPGGPLNGFVEKAGMGDKIDPDMIILTEPVPDTPPPDWGPLDPTPSEPVPPPPPDYPPNIEWTGPDGRERELVWNPEHNSYQNRDTGGLVADVEAWKKNIADTEAQTDDWRERNKQLEESGQDAQSRALAEIDAKYQAEQAKIAADLKASQALVKQIKMAQLKKLLQDRQDSFTKKADEADRYNRIMDSLVSGAEWTEWLADRSLDVLSKVTGTKGKVIKAVYTGVKDVAKNVTDSYVNDKGIAPGLKRGVAEAAIDLGWDALKDVKWVQKIPGFGKYTGGNYGGESHLAWEKAITQTGMNWQKQEAMREATRNAVKGTLQGRAQSYVVKDPIKSKMLEPLDIKKAPRIK